MTAPQSTVVPALEITNLQAWYGESHILHNLSLSVNPGEVVTNVHWTMSGMVVLMTLVGGMGTLAGPIVGVILIVALENRLGNVGNFLAAMTHIDWFKEIGQSVTTVIGLIFIICVLAFRRGIVGEMVARWPRRR